MQVTVNSCEVVENRNFDKEMKGNIFKVKKIDVYELERLSMFYS